MNKELKEKLISIGKGALIAGTGAILTYLAENLSQVDFGDYTPVVVALLSVLVNTGRKLLSK